MLLIMSKIRKIESTS